MSRALLMALIALLLAPLHSDDSFGAAGQDPATPRSGPTPPVWNPENGHYYEIRVDVLAWCAAAAQAQSLEHAGLPGYLATVTSTAEWDFLQAALGADSFRGCWLGGFQPEGSSEPAGGWRWVTGEPWSYENWGPGEPDNAGSNENALQVDPSTLQWNDVGRLVADDLVVRGYVVEYGPAVDHQAPVAHYPLDGNTLDSGPYQIHGTVYGNARAGADRFGNPNGAFYFDGDGDYIAAPAHPLPTRDRTVAFWFRREPGGGRRPCILGYGGISCGESWFMQVHDSLLAMSSHCDRNAIMAEPTPPLWNAWVHLAVTTGPSGTRMYRDGFLIAANDNYVTNTVVCGKQLALGVDVSPGGLAPYTDINVEYFQGWLDDVRIYARALTSSEIAVLAGLPAMADLRGHWRFEEASGDVALDASAHGNHGQIEGGSLRTQDVCQSNLPGIGANERALVFDGDSARVIVPDAPSLRPNAELTLEAWIRPGPAGGSIVGKPVNSSCCVSHSNSYQLEVDVAQSRRINFIISDNAVGTIQHRIFGPTLVPGECYHVAGTWDGLLMRLYVNGQLVGTEPFAGAIGYDSNPLVIGADIDLDGQQPCCWFDGTVDEVRLTARALAPSEFLVAPTCPATMGLVAHYALDGDATDATGNGRNGTIVGDVDAAMDRFGNPTGAMEFHGDVDYIRADGAGLPTAERTVSLWFLAFDVDTKPVFMGYGGNTSCGTAWFMGLNGCGQSDVYVSTHCQSNHVRWPYPSPPVGQWRHVAISTSATGTRIYMDGALVTTDGQFIQSTVVDSTDLGIGVATGDGDVPFTDGCIGYFNGRIDDLRIYDRELPPEEVLGLFTCSPTDSPEQVRTPGTTRLYQNVPNPFNPSTVISFDLATRGRVELSIYDVSGRRVRRLVDQHMNAGLYRLQWDGRNDDGNGLASGVYYYQLRVNGVASGAGRAVLVR